MPPKGAHHDRDLNPSFYRCELRTSPPSYPTVLLCFCIPSFLLIEVYAVMLSVSTRYAALASPEFPAGIYKCFRFAYHMFGDTMGKLEVHAHGSRKTEFIKTGMASDPVLFPYDPLTVLVKLLA